MVDEIAEAVAHRMLVSRLEDHKCFDCSHTTDAFAYLTQRCLVHRVVEVVDVNVSKVLFAIHRWLIYLFIALCYVIYVDR